MRVFYPIVWVLVMRVSHPASAFLSPVNVACSRRSTLLQKNGAQLAGKPSSRDEGQVDDCSRTPRSGLKQFLSTIFNGTAVAALTVVLSLFLTSTAHADDAAVRGGSNMNSGSRRYWDSMESSQVQERVTANENLLDYAVGMINTMYYDNSGGAYFTPREFYDHWRKLRDASRDELARSPSLTNFLSKQTAEDQVIKLDSREGAIKGLRQLMNQLDDPFSKYLTRDELVRELKSSNDGFLGTGAIVETPEEGDRFFARSHTPTIAMVIPDAPQVSNKRRAAPLLNAIEVKNLPVVTAVSPDSPAERAGITVGDRISAVGDFQFLGKSRDEVSQKFKSTYTGAESYVGHSELTVAKPVFRSLAGDQDRELVIGYRSIRVKLPTISLEPSPVQYRGPDSSVGGNTIVHYELLSSSDASIFKRSMTSNSQVGYIRLTRFSRASTTGFLEAVNELERRGATSFIIDLRNNYGGVIQEAMLMASSLLRDPHAVLCFTMNSRGGFTPHDVEEFVVDSRYPGYLLSTESKSATLNQVKRETPALFHDNGSKWVPPSSYASLHEQFTKRGYHRPTSYSSAENSGNVGSSKGSSTVVSYDDLNRFNQHRAQKNIILLLNEGTASAAEVFASALHDNGRTVATIGTKTYGKGLIQHTFPLPDGGGLRLTVAEYLTPTLQHVTNVGSARFDRLTGELVGGGIHPDVQCESKHGIPANIGADLCVGVALDILDEVETVQQSSSKSSTGIGGGGKPVLWKGQTGIDSGLRRVSDR